MAAGTGTKQNRSITEPTRTTKTNPKLVLFPDSGVDLSSQTEYSVSRSGFEKSHITNVRRVTAYLTAESLKLRELQNFLLNSRSNNAVDPKRYDEVLYTPFYFNLNGDLCKDASSLQENVASQLPIGEVFYFDYGVTVIWGLEESQELQILNDLKRFEVTPIILENVEIEAFKFCHDPDLPPRLVNDVINLKSGHHMIKLTISHALAQSVKLTYFEELVERTILRTKDIPNSLAIHGTIALSRYVFILSA